MIWVWIEGSSLFCTRAHTLGEGDSHKEEMGGDGRSLTYIAFPTSGGFPEVSPEMGDERMERMAIVCFPLSYLSFLTGSHSSQGLRWWKDFSPRLRNSSHHYYSTPIHRHSADSPIENGAR